MVRRIDTEKRKMIERTGKATTDFPYFVGKGAVSLAVSLIVVSLMIAAAQKNPQTQVAQEQLGQEPLLEPSQVLEPMTLTELLAEMSKRLGTEGVVARVRGENGTLRVLVDGPMFPLSKATVASSKQNQIAAVADTLAWAVHCHVRFTGELSGLEAKDVFRECGLADSQTYKCIPEKGRVEVAGIRFEGHADAVPFRKNSVDEKETERFTNNQELSDARSVYFANQVVQCAEAKLRSLGAEVNIPHETRGYSDSMPAEQDSKDPKNRRVEIHFDESGRFDPVAQ